MFELVDMLTQGLTLTDDIILIMRFAVLCLLFKFIIAFMNTLVGGRSFWR